MMRKSRQIFDVPLSTQRYTRVSKIIQDCPDISSITDFGCGNGRFVLWIKDLAQLELINCVDTDYALLEYEIDNSYFKPGLCETIFGRRTGKTELLIKVYHGNVTIPDECLKSDCITMIEVIEHMHLNEVENATRSIFGFYQPKLVIVTTPNREFNHLLRVDGEPASEFRHSDHKFEWNRQEFYQWASSICHKYNYQCSFDGVGSLDNSQGFGPCTQIAIFHRKNLPLTPCERDADTFDLLLNKMSIKENIDVWSMERRRNEVSKIVEYKIPLAISPTLEAPKEEFDWNMIDH